MPILRDLYKQAVTQAPSIFEAGEIFRHVTGSLPADDCDKPASSSMERELAELLEKRAGGYPLQYLLGEWEFYGLPFRVGPGVLIPRQDTETLVDVALSIARERDKGRDEILEVLDLCSGSGCVAIALGRYLPDAKVTALEFSSVAYSYLEHNIALNGQEVTPVLMDLRDYTHPAPLDLVVSNPPYIPRRDFPGLQTEVGHEPIVALSGGEDGLSYFRAIARRYAGQIKPGGVLLLEIGAGQNESVAEILAAFGFEGIRGHVDLNGIVRVMEARRPFALKEFQ